MGKGRLEDKDHQTLLTVEESGRDHEHRELQGEGLSVPTRFYLARSTFV